MGKTPGFGPSNRRSSRRLPVRLRRRVVFENLGRPCLGERAERYARASLVPRSSDLILGAVGVSYKMAAGDMTPGRRNPQGKEDAK